MGKQKRPRRSTKKNHVPKQPVDTSLPAVLQRLRHANPEIRAATIYGLSSSKHLEFRILQELRDQVKDSAAAATILISYLNDERMASWWSTFIQTVREERPSSLACLQCCVELLENNPISNNVDEDVPLLMQIAISDNDSESSILAARCLHAISETSDAVNLEVIQPKLDSSLRGIHLLGACINTMHGFRSDNGHHYHHYISILIQALDAFDYMQSLEHVITVYKAYETCQKDKTLEDGIIQKQKEKHEPARLIARRLKQEGMDLDHGEEGDDKQQRGGDMKSMDRTDVDSNWKTALSDWERFVEPVELALELLANITMQQQIQTGELIPAVGRFMEKLNSMAIQDPSLPTAIQESLSSLLTKAAACAGNLVLISPNEQLWQCLQQATQTAPVLAAQSLVLKKHALLPVPSWDTYISLVVAEGSDEAVRREAIVVLAALCTREAHGVEANRAVAQALIQCPDTSGSVVTERLNAIMDIYGDDDCHPAVFDELKLLDFCKKHRKLLRERINVGSVGDTNEEELAAWKEAAENAAEFIRYKEDQVADMDLK